MAKRRSLAVVATAFMALAAAPATYAADGGGGSSTVTATITAGAIGSRSVTSVTPVALTTSLNTPTLSGTLGVVVTESARTGTNPWSVTAQSSVLTDAASDTIAATNMSADNRAVTPAGGGGTSTPASGSSALSSAATLFSNASQSTTAVYTGTYTSTSDIHLSVPNAQPVGVYTGTMTITLVQ